MRRDKIKVCHIVTRLDFGGAQFNTLYTASHLDKDCFDASIISGPGGTMSENTGGIPFISPEKLSVVNDLRREIGPFRDIKAVFRIAAQLKKIKPDIVHTHSSKAGILGRIAALMAGVPAIVHTFHGFGFHPYQNCFVRGFYVLLEKICASFSSRLVFVSKSNIEYAKSLGIGSPVKYCLIRSGIKLSDYPAKTDRAELLESLGIRECGADGRENIVVLSIGNSKPQKNPGDFVRAAAEICRTRKNVFFVFAGGGKELPKFREMAAELGIADRCVFPGWRADSAQLLYVCDIYAMTSLWEGLPRSLAEAFASGKPAVCYCTDGVTDILQDGINGYSTEKKDLKTFTARLSEVIDSPELRTKLACGAEKTDLSDFDIDFMVKQQEKLYAGLAGKADVPLSSLD